MLSFWSSSVNGGTPSSGGGGGGGGGVSFNSCIRVVNADNTISIRHMNPHGGYYDTEENAYDEDGSQSYNLDASQADEDGLTFMDAVQDLVHQHAKHSARVAHNTLGPLSASDDDMGDQYFHSSGYDCHTTRTTAEAPLQISRQPCFSPILVCCTREHLVE
jgi:hypothetical protein